MTGDIVINLRGGKHTLTSPLTLTAQDSGTGGFKVIYRSYPGERAVISGGQTITGWNLFDAGKNLYRASAPNINTRQLYVNGAKAQRARSSQNPAGFTKTSSGFTTTNPAIAGYRNLTEVELVGFHGWRDFYCRIGGVSGGNITMQNPCWNNSQRSLPGVAFNTVSYIENAYELLDAAGEWYYDRPAGYIYYIPRAGENMASAEVIAPKSEKLIDGQGTPGAPVHDISFTGLTFAYAGWNFPSSANGYVVYQTGFYIDTAAPKLVPGNVHFTAARNVIFQDNVFAHLGAAGLNFENSSQNITILANKFEDISSNAISLGNVWDEATTNTNNQNRNFSVANNYITRTGFEYYDASGIMGGYLDAADISHNEIYNISHSPVTLGWGWGTNSYAKNNSVSYNYLHKFTQVLEDSAGVYTLSSQPGTQIHHNHIDQAIRNFGCLYPDEGSANINWHQNVCQGVPQWLHIWTGSIHDNMVQNNYSDTANMENKGTNNTVNSNNVITGGNWPAEAQSIMAGAGIEAAYAGVKTLPLPIAQ